MPHQACFAVSSANQRISSLRTMAYNEILYIVAEIICEDWQAVKNNP